MEQLIIFLLLALGSAISSYVQKKKKLEQSRRGAAGAPTEEPPVPHWPAPARDWQEELRRLVQGESRPAPARPETPPPVIKALPTARSLVSPAKPLASEGTVVLKSPLIQSAAAYNRAADLSRRVGQKLEVVDRQMKSHPAQPVAPRHRVRPPAAAVVRRWTGSPEAVREAFVASIIFDPPLALQNH
jgi:hypothetical protein